MPSRALVGVACALALAALSGCADGKVMCRVGTDCASGICGTDGTCVRPPDLGEPDAALDSGELPDLGVPDDLGPPFDGGVRVCTPNHDGTVTRDEVPLRAGLRANFRLAQSVTVSTAGTITGAGRVWDYSGAYTGDRDELVELLAPGANWWAAEFPTATHAARVSASSDNLGVFQITDTALLLLGVVSPTGGVGTQTLLRYSPAVTVLAFPLVEGNTFTTTSAVTGSVALVSVSYTEVYTSNVDASGTLITPFGELPALRVRTQMTRTSFGVTLTSQRQFSFVGECFGIAAVVVSNALEATVDFTAASEIRRLSP
jgi:hypothetical protein